MRELRQRALQHRALPRPLMRRPEGPADRMIDERGAGRDDFAHDVVRRPDHQRRNAACFDDVGDETDGLMTEGSVGDEESELDARSLELVRQRGSKIVFDLCMLAHPAHERIVKRCECGDRVIFGQSGERGARKNDLRVLLRHCADAGVVIDDYPPPARIGRHLPIAQVFAWNKWLLIAQSKRGAAQ